LSLLSQVVNASSQMLLFQRAQYCPAPPGDSITRKSLFDSLVAGCVPVLFAKASLGQYLWFFTAEEVRTIRVLFVWKTAFDVLCRLLKGDIQIVDQLRSDLPL
jgi:hypothetical protein